MANTTKSRTENENYWGYIIFAGVVLLYLFFSDAIWENNNARTNNRQMSGTRNYNTVPTNANNTNSGLGNYCSLSSSQTFDYLLAQRSLTLNGNGSVRFNKRFDHARNKWTEDKFIVTSNGYRLEGEWKVVRGNTIKITNYKVISGTYDASNNSASVGVFTIRCNGNIEGILRDRNGNSIDISIRK